MGMSGRTVAVEYRRSGEDLWLLDEWDEILDDAEVPRTELYEAEIDTGTKARR